MNSLKSLAMNCGPLSEMIRGRASGYFSFILLPAVEDRGLESKFIAELRDGLLVEQMPVVRRNSVRRFFGAM